MICDWLALLDPAPKARPSLLSRANVQLIPLCSLGLLAKTFGVSSCSDLRFLRLKWREDATNWKPYCACGNSSAVTHARTSSSQWRPCASEDGRLPVPEAQNSSRHLTQNSRKNRFPGSARLRTALTFFIPSALSSSCPVSYNTFFVLNIYTSFR